MLSARYEKVISQGRRNDILKEIEEIGTCGHDVHKSKSRDGIGEEYGMTGRNIARYMRVDQLVRPLKYRLDAGELTLAAAVDLSYLPEEGQEAVSNVMEALKIKLTPKITENLRGHDGNLDEKIVMKLISAAIEKKPSTDKVVKVELSAEIRKRYFDGMNADQMAKVVEQALEAWFSGKEAADV